MFIRLFQIGDRLLGIDREPIGWLSLEDLQRFSYPFDSLTFEFGRLPLPPSPSFRPSPASSTTVLRPPPSGGLGGVGLSPLKEDDESMGTSFTKPISVVVEDNPPQKASNVASPVKVQPTAIASDDTNDDEEEAGSNVKIRQVGLELI